MNPNLFAVLLLAGLGTAVAAPADFSVRVPLEQSGDGPWYRLPLPIEAQFAARHGDLRDLRILDAAGQALPYSLRAGAARQAETRQELAVRVFPLRGPAGGAAPDSLKVVRNTTGTIVEIAPGGVADAGELLRGWLLDASAGDFPLSRLSLDWSAEREGFQRFRIEASDDLSSWRYLGEGQLARLSFNGERIDKHEVELPQASRARYLRLLWLDPQQAAMLTGARLSGVRSSAEAAPLVWSQPLAGQAGRAGAFSWELPLALPLERVRVVLGQPSTLAPVSLQGRRDGKAGWSPLARGLLYRLPLQDGEVREEELGLPGWPVSQLRLQVDERGGGLGQAAPQLRVALRATEVIFLARGAGPYQLALGSATAQDASLPLGTLVPGYDETRLAAMGTSRLAGELRQALPAEQSAAAGIDWKRVGLWGVLLAGVGLLAAMAFSLLRAPKPRA